MFVADLCVFNYSKTQIFIVRSGSMIAPATWPTAIYAYYNEIILFIGTTMDRNAAKKGECNRCDANGIGKFTPPPPSQHFSGANCMR